MIGVMIELQHETNYKYVIAKYFIETFHTYYVILSLIEEQLIIIRLTWCQGNSRRLPSNQQALLTS